jgi:hypothetical protein
VFHGIFFLIGRQRIQSLHLPPTLFKGKLRTAEREEFLIEGIANRGQLGMPLRE